MRRRSSIALPSFGVRRGSNASTSSSVKDEIVRDIFHVGLVNLGNSCFYNTIVQSLSATQPLSDIINAAPDSSPALQVLSPSSPSYNPDLDALPSPLPMTAALLVLLDKLDPTGKDEDAKPKGKKAFNPKSLLRQLSLKHEEYAEATQQDSHELLRHLIDGVMMEEQDLIKKILEATPDTLPHRPSMHERLETVRPSDHSTPVPDQAVVSESEEDSGDESDASSASSSSSSSSDAESDVEETRLTERQRKKRKLRPFVGSIFEGKLASFIICDECKNVSLTKEDFMDISLSLKDETTNRMRKRDRIRRTLQAGFFSRKSGKSTASSGDDSSSKEPPSIKTAPNGVRRERVSLSENEGSASPSEADETDEDHIRPRMDRTAGGGARSRRNSLDPSRLSRETARETSLQVPGERSAATRNSSRDASPLGRALSVLSNGSGEKDAQHPSSSYHGHGHHGHQHHFHFHRRPKIPKPTPEQVAYIKKVLVDIPGPSATQGLPPGLRVARPPGSSAPPPVPAPTGTPTHSQDSVISTTSSLSKLRIAAAAVEWQNTDLFECFRQFTSVEVLEGENSFACRNCWKWLNPDLEAKRKEERARKKREREERRRARRAAKKGLVGGDGHAAGQNGHAAGAEEDSGDERDPADVTARNTPAHSPKAVPAFAPLEEIPPIQPIEAAVPAPSTNGTSIAPVSPTTTTAKSGVPMRSFSISSAATSNAVSVSTDYEGGISSEAFETTTDEEDNTSPGLDDAASLSGSLGALPGTEGKKLPLTVENVQAVAAASTAPPTGSLAVPQDERRGEPAASPAPSSAASLAPPPPAGSGASPSLQPLHGHSRPTKPPPKKQRQILRRAHKRYLISPTDLPPVLVIHLKRFMQTSKSSLFGSAFVNLKKRDDPVSFPKEMDLTPFLAPAGKPPRVNPNAFGSAEVEEERRSRKSSRNGGVDRPDSSGTEVSEAIEVEKEVHNARYRLYAVVVHHGTIDTGHYASYVLSNRHGKASERKWLFCSDEEVLSATEAEVLRSKAYMLFYERATPEQPPTGASASQPPPAASSTANTAGVAGDSSNGDGAPQPVALPDLTEEPAPLSHPPTTTVASPPPPAAALA
ncbi:hypothetical protein JCM10296v2_006341 [Rhodotorula toruloides]